MKNVTEYKSPKTLQMVVATLLGLSIAFLTAHSYNVFASSDENCDPSYPDVCIAPPPPDLNCGDVPHKDITVVGDDPHGLDREGDGIGCES